MSRYPLDFADWGLKDIKPWQFWRKGEQQFYLGIILGDMADYPSFGEDSKTAKMAEDIADKTSSDPKTMRLLKKSVKRYKKYKESL